MPLQAATRSEPEVLHEGALATSVLDAAAQVRSPRALAGPPADPPIGGPRAHKTGVGGTVPKPDRAAEARKANLDLLEQGLTVTGDMFKRWATSKGRDRAALDKAVADALEAFVKAEGVKMAEQLPFGKVIMVCFDLSLAFAEGVGRGLTLVNAELARKYDSSRIGAELTPEDIAQIQVIRGYLAENTRQLNRVIAEGLKDVVDKAADMVFEKLGEIPGKVLGDLAGQVAGQLTRQNDLLAILRSATDEAAKNIPEARGKVERLAFHFVATAFVNQLEDKELQKRLAPLPGVAKSGKPVDVALLGTIIKMLAESSYATYKRHVQVDYAAGEIRTMLVATARNLAAGLVDVELEDSGSAEIIVEKDRVAVPTAWLAALTEDAELGRAVEREYWARGCEFRDFLKRLRLSMDERRRGYAREYAAKTRRTGADMDLHIRMQTRWVDDWRKAHQRANQAIEAITEELGDPTGDHRRLLEADIWVNLGRVNEPGTFAPSGW